MTQHPLTFLFTDLENSTSLWEQFPDEMRQASARHDALIRKIIESHQGIVVKTTGDGFHAVFASPSDAIAAAVDGQQAIDVESWPNATGSLKVRMGLHTGESQERDGDYYGPEVNLAARVMGLGYGGQILLSETTTILSKKSLPQNCTLTDLGEHRLKGIANPERIFQLCHPALPVDFPPLKSLTSFKHNFRRQLSTFIGREKELADVKHLLKDTQCLTLLGPGGTGKTRLMLQVAEEVIEDYSDGVWLVELAPLTNPDLIPERVAASLNIQEQPGRNIIETIIDFLRYKELLILLDNIEHLVRECAVFTETLLENCPKLKILVTGREALFIPGETTIQIPSLSLPEDKQNPEEIIMSEGVQLFIERARDVRPDFKITKQNATSIAEIVRRLDGIPLAIELAVARLRMLSVEQISTRLNDRFHLLTGGRRTALPRQQTLQALIDWSWNLLDEQEQILLRRLSVFSGGWNLEAAQSVAGFNPLNEFDVFDTLDQLIKKSLVIVQHTSGSDPRYSMLESIHQYAQNRLLETEEAGKLRDRHVDYFVDLVDTFNENSLGQEFYLWKDRFELETDNLRAVMTWISEDNPQLTLHLTGALFQFGMDWMHFREAKSWLEPAILQAKKLMKAGSLKVDRTDYARALMSLGWLLVTHGDMENGHSYLDECIQVARQYKEHRILAFAISMKAQAMGTNVTPKIIDQIEDVIAFSRQRNDNYELFMTLFSAGQAYIQTGQLEKGKTYLDEVIEIIEKHEIPFFSSWVYFPQALLAKREGDLTKAEKYFMITIDSLSEIRDRRMVTTAQSELAHLYRQQGRLDEAEAIYRQTILSWQEQGHLSAVAHQVECIAFITIAQKQYKSAARLLGAAQQARTRINAISTEAQEIAELEQAMESLTVALGEEVRDDEMAKGSRMSLDAAVIFALEATNPDNTNSNPNTDIKMHLDNAHKFDRIPSSNHK